MRLLMPFSTCRTPTPNSPNLQMKTRLGGLPFRISNTTIAYVTRAARGGSELLSTCRFHLPLNDDREREGKSGALAGLGFDPDSAPVHLNDPLRYGESQAGAALLAGDRIICLLKLLKQPGLVD